ncbi:MAG TPA: NAD(P)-dependent oxidoreductase [Solirubrobacteraceae bacterium]|nr:NAD(P)-dependent oxidoreductase [Solirubrobacteraceae bacterium]
MSRVLVTGASGFVGVPLLSELVALGAEVHAVHSRGDVAPIEGVSWHRVDLADEAAVTALLAATRPERLAHLAWYVEHGRFWSSPENVVWVEHSLGLLRAFAAAGGRRALLLGTCAEYDWSGVRGPLRELGSPLRPATAYGTAKDSLRHLAEIYTASFDIELAWARLFFMYGPREQPARLVPAVIRGLLAGEPMPTSGGEQVRDFLHVRDVGGALAALLCSEVTGPVNIASGIGTKVREVIAEIASQVGRPELVRYGALPERLDEPPLLVADIERLRREVGFESRIGLAEGIAETISWWRERR